MFAPGQFVWVSREGRYCLGKVVDHAEDLPPREAMAMQQPGPKERLVRLYPRRRWELKVVLVDHLVDFVSGMPVGQLPTAVQSSGNAALLKESIADAIADFQQSIGVPVPESEKKRALLNGATSAKRVRADGGPSGGLNAVDALRLRNEQSQLNVICTELRDAVQQKCDADALKLAKMLNAIEEERQKVDLLSAQNAEQLRAANVMHRQAISAIEEIADHVSRSVVSQNASNR